MFTAKILAHVLHTSVVVSLWGLRRQGLNFLFIQEEIIEVIAENSELTKLSVMLQSSGKCNIL